MSHGSILTTAGSSLLVNHRCCAHGRPCLEVACLLAIALSACSDGSVGPEPRAERLNTDIRATVSFDGLAYPTLRLSVTASARSSLGHRVTVTAITVDGAQYAAPTLVAEGTHDICATVTSASGKTSSECRRQQLSWPKYRGRASVWDETGGHTPAGLVVTTDANEAFAVTSDDGAFAVPSVNALAASRTLTFTSPAVLPSRLTIDPGQPINVVLIPRQVTIPPCSVYGGQVVDIDLQRAYMPLSGSNSAYFDRATTLATSRKIVVASWNMESIPVAFSDTGGVQRRFSASDSSEVAAALATLTSYICLPFHPVPVAEARQTGVVIVKDPDFPALGGHAMALPQVRGDYTKAEVVLPTITPPSGSAPDATRRTTMHEFLHVLGFGHTCSWPSVMTTGTVCAPELRATLPSREDVAYYFAMRYARAGERAMTTVNSFVPAYVAAAEFRGEPTPVVAPYFPQP